MPELPEVETIKNALAARLHRACIKRVAIRRFDLRRTVSRSLPSRVEGLSIHHIKRRGKFLLLYLGRNDVDQNANHDVPSRILMIHLGMSGHIRIDSPTSPLKTHDHVIMDTSHGHVIYHDPRRFGWIDDVPPSTRHWPLAIRQMGPEPLSARWNWQRLQKDIGGRAAPIKNLLLDQRIVAGIGNIYACEALFGAGISPLRSGGGLNDDECRRLHRALRCVLRRAIAAGGSTLRDHQLPDQTPGYFQHDFVVYGRAGKPCPRCRRTIIRLRFGGRSTFSCPNCQKEDTSTR